MNVHELCLQSPSPSTTHSPTGPAPHALLAPQPGCKHGHSPQHRQPGALLSPNKSSLGTRGLCRSASKGSRWHRSLRRRCPRPPRLPSSWGDAARGAHCASAPAHLPRLGANTHPALAVLDTCLAKLGSPETRPRASPRPSASPAQPAGLGGTGALGTHPPMHVPGVPLAGDRDLGGFLRTVQKHCRSFSHTRIRKAERRPVSPS